MSNKEPPQILRVKRKRTDDPLQALVMETSRRQIKKPRYVFRLKRTEERDIQDSTTVLTASDNLKNNKPVFNLSSSRKSISTGNDLDDRLSRGSISEGNTNTAANIVDEQPMELNPQLLEMLNDYLKDNDETTISNPVKPPKRRQSSISQDLNVRPTFSNEQMLRNAIAIDEQDDDIDSEYVYDVYYRDKAISDQWENEKIGYIKFDDDDAGFLDEKDEFMMNTDDEDSNDENFYRNDYPDDEDAGYDDEAELESMGVGERSDDQDDEFDIINDKRRFSKLDFMRNEGLKSMSDDEYQNLTAQIDDDPEVDFSRNNDDDEEMEMDTYVNDTDNFNHSDIGFERNEFFKSDLDDPIAIHRDRIFGKLQQMIDEEI